MQYFLSFFLFFSDAIFSLFFFFFQMQYFLFFLLLFSDAIFSLFFFFFSDAIFSLFFLLFFRCNFFRCNESKAKAGASSLPPLHLFLSILIAIASALAFWLLSISFLLIGKIKHHFDCHHRISSCLLIALHKFSYSWSNKTYDWMFNQETGNKWLSGSVSAKSQDVPMMNQPGSQTPICALLIHSLPNELGNLTTHNPKNRSYIWF